MNLDLRVRCLLRAEPRIRPHTQLRELRLSFRFTPDECSQECAEESKRNADDPWILQREERLLHEIRIDEDQCDTRDQPDSESANCARGVKALPENRKDDDRQIRAR